VHIALVDADCAGAELAHFDADIPSETRVLDFAMLSPTRGHDGHLVTLTATFRDHEFRKLAADGRFVRVRRQLLLPAN
jgi:hypothetical protein